MAFTSDLMRGCCAARPSQRYYDEHVLTRFEYSVQRSEFTRQACSRSYRRKENGVVGQELPFGVFQAVLLEIRIYALIFPSYPSNYVPT